MLPHMINVNASEPVSSRELADTRLVRIELGWIQENTVLVCCSSLCIMQDRRCFQLIEHNRVLLLPTLGPLACAGRMQQLDWNPQSRHVCARRSGSACSNAVVAPRRPAGHWPCPIITVVRRLLFRILHATPMFKSMGSLALQVLKSKCRHRPGRLVTLAAVQYRNRRAMIRLLRCPHPQGCLLPNVVSSWADPWSCGLPSSDTPSWSSRRSGRRARRLRGRPPITRCPPAFLSIDSTLLAHLPFDSLLQVVNHSQTRRHPVATCARALRCVRTAGAPPTNRTAGTARRVFHFRPPDRTIRRNLIGITSSLQLSYGAA
mmetsp:Transcript_72414/g.193035  ORF Transcript_72414/g.193035 Transcript_72414/m.193035 type:complete len:318 (+) Transcript_72414:799-1752(+)